MTAFDASPVMVSLARQQTAGRVRIDQAALGEPLPYPGGAFDLVVCALAIHYARDRPPSPSSGACCGPAGPWWCRRSTR